MLAQTRQADRDKAQEEAAARHRDEIATGQQQLLAQNTDITKLIHQLTEDLHAHILGTASEPSTDSKN